MPYLVIVVELVALAAAAALAFYQRFIGKRFGSLALISQSIDSRNHIYVACAVIIGAVFSLFGLHFVDAVIGAFIAVRIVIDGVELTKETVSTMKGEETDFSKFTTRMERKLEARKYESFRNWILYSIRKEGLDTKGALIRSLERTFKTDYIPILSEFQFSLGMDTDFRVEFDAIIEPLLDLKCLRVTNGKFVLTIEGKRRVERVFKTMRFHRST